MTMQRAVKKLKSKTANAIVENVIVLPIILMILMLIIIMCFVVHDRATIEAAAKRGAIYAAHCISNPSYDKILSQSSNQSGSLDVSIDGSGNGEVYSFKGIASNIKPYRYFSGSTNGLSSKVEAEVREIIKKTRIPWRNIEVNKIEFKQNNKIYYQDVSVTVTVDYAVSPIFKVVGVDPKYTYSATAVMTVNDPDEFIRNADIVVDLITMVDEKTGGHLKDLSGKISSIASKLIEWTKIAG